jgi:DNA adenine methylase|tara:strand:- start:808 stop:1500 length:693 start_codon:yes stop_codon:yes gene_type:complete
VVNSFLFFSGEIEFNLAQADRFVVARTSNYPIYEFWRCAFDDPGKIMEISRHFYNTLFDEEKIFKLLQTNWASYKDPFVRAALFFLLNRCSSTGMISSGKFTPNNFNAFALTNLKKFNPQNLYTWYDEKSTLLGSIDSVDESVDYLLLPVGEYKRNLLEGNYEGSLEETYINHKHLHQKMSDITKKWIILYKFHPEAAALYKDYNIIKLNKYGRPTDNNKEAEELIIANF